MSEVEVVIPARPDSQAYPLGAAAYDMSNKITFIIDPKEFDREKISELQKAIGFAEGNEKQKALKTLQNHLAEEVKKQLEKAHPGASHKVDPQDLQILGMSALLKGPFSAQFNYDQGLACFVNVGPRSRETALQGATELAGIKAERLKPLPGAPEAWLQFTGNHEGAHCNRYDSGYNENPLKTLKAEKYADDEALKKLRKEGHHGVANAVIDLRIIGAVDSLFTVPADKIPASHATGFFLNQDGSSREPTEQDLKVLEDMKEIMLDAFWRKLGPEASATDAVELYKKDPDKFHKLLQEAHKEGLLAARPMMADEAKERMAKELGMSIQDIEKKRELDIDFNAKYIQLAEKLYKENQFSVPDENVQRYVQMYMDAYDRRIIQPAPEPKPMAEAEVKTSGAPKAELETENPSAKAASFQIQSGPGRYDYLLAELPDLIKNRQEGISINPDTWKINSGGLNNLTEAFAIEADPFLSGHKQTLIAEQQALRTQFLGATNTAEFKTRTTTIVV